MAHMLFGNGHHQTQVCFAQAAAGVQAIAAGLEQLSALFVAQGAVLHSLHSFLFGSLFLGILAGLLVALLVQIFGIAAAVLILFKREAGAVLFDVLRPAVLLAVGLLRAQQRDLADLLEVVLNGVVQQFVHGSLQVCRILLALLFLVLADAHIIVVVLGILDLGHDAVHIQRRLCILFQNLDAAFFQKGVERFLIHSALCSQRLGLLGRNGTFAFRQQFL